MLKLLLRAPIVKACNAGHVEVSVVIATCNRPILVWEAVESIRNQTIRDWELLVVDDASDDGVVDGLRSRLSGDKRCRLVCNRIRVGPAQAFNQGIREALGRLIAIMGDDDIALPAR
ncbi:MAG: glycosyltransferase family 2 protein [Verrucomicrobiae bacterium]|nr:glycosyltransferase family 2 protein [Verrucomicrobiae bacterium]